MTACFRRPKSVTADSEHYPAYLQTLCDTLNEGLQAAPDPDAGTGNEATDDDNLALRTAHQIFAASHLGQLIETLRCGSICTASDCCCSTDHQWTRLI